MFEIGKNVFDNAAFKLRGDKMKASLVICEDAYADERIGIECDPRPDRVDPIAITLHERSGEVEVTLTAEQARDIAGLLIVQAQHADEKATEWEAEKQAQQEDEATRPDAPTEQEREEHAKEGDTTERVSLLPEEAIGSLREAGEVLSRALSQVKPIRVVHRGDRR